MRSVKLRHFQQQAVEDLRERIPDIQRAILCAPTGSGKTYTGCAIAKLALKKKNNVCILVHRRELLKQFYNSLNNFKLDPEIVSPENKRIHEKNLYLGMVETFHRRININPFWKNINLFILDEAHSTIYYKIIEQFPNAFVLGLTATPQASGQVAPLNQYYNDIIEMSDVETLIREGYLVDSRTFSIEADTKLLKKRGKDYSEESQLELFHTPKVYEGDLQNYTDICKGAKFICYTVNVAHSLETAKKFNEAGYPCKHIDGNTDKGTRDKTLKEFRKGKIRGISNFGIVTAGFDEESVECIIQNFATAELSKTIQTAGRGSRPSRLKSDFVIIDMGANYARHGLWNSNRDWKDIFWNPKSSSERERQRQEDKHNLMCDECGMILTVKDEECSYCGREVIKLLQDKSKDAKGVKLKHIREELKSRIPERLRKTPFSMSYSELEEYGKIMGYKDSWKFTIIGQRNRRITK